MTDRLAAEVGGAEGCHEAEENRMPLGRVWAGSCREGTETTPRCRVAPRAGMCSWDSGPRAGSPHHSLLFLLPASRLDSTCRVTPDEPLPPALCLGLCERGAWLGTKPPGTEEEAEAWGLGGGCQSHAWH